MIGGLIVFIASVQLIRIAVRRCNQDPNNDQDNERDNERDNDRDNGQDNEWDNDRDNDPMQNLLSNPSCNITVSKKDDFNSGKFGTGPI